MSQLITFNAVKQRSCGPERIPRHIRERETPLSIYIGIKLYVMTRKESIIDMLHEQGICISYKRLRTLSTDLANSAIAHFKHVGVVVPRQAIHRVFTTFAFDNIDHNPGATTSRSSFHGTCISLLQFPDHDSEIEIEDNRYLDPEAKGKKNVEHLPVNYTTMQHIALPKEDVYVPDLNIDSELRPHVRPLNETLESAYDWLTHAHQLLQKETLDQNDWISWAAYNAVKYGQQPRPITPSVMLPLFRESAHSPLMVYHGMNVICAVTNHINPGQTPVMVVDQPLFTIAKKIQWKYSDELGENKFVVMLGAMHTEKMLYDSLGDWLDGSGWTSLLTSSGVVSGGVAQSFVNVSHLTRTRYFHQVTALSLFTLLKLAYMEYVQLAIEDEPMTFQKWVDHHSAARPQFRFWYDVLEIELTVSEFIKANRTGSFDLYKESLEHLLP